MQVYEHTCCDVQQVSGLLSTRCFLLTDLSRVELTLRQWLVQNAQGLMDELDERIWLEEGDGHGVGNEAAPHHIVKPLRMLQLLAHCSHELSDRDHPRLVGRC